MKKLLWILILIALITGALYVVSLVGASDFEKRSQTAFQALEQNAVPSEQSRYALKDFNSLPQVARAYLQKAMPAGGPRRRRISLQLSGETKMAEDASWDEFQARQLITATPPQMAWAAKAAYAPMLPVTTLVTLQGGEGKVISHLWGMTEMFSNSGYGVKRYLMLRWLAEAVWHPASLLPGKYVSWQKAENPTANALAARVKLSLGQDKAAGMFVFTSLGGAPMMFLADPITSGQFSGQRWYCNYSDWKRQGDLQIPFSMIQGVRNGISNDVRLRFKVDAIKYD
jgi:hypothetical protein